MSSAEVESAPLRAIPPPRERANIARLAVAQALAGANSTVIYATGAVIGAAFAPNAALATLPISVFVVGMAACSLPCGAIARRYGRRAAFLVGSGCGVFAGLFGALAVTLRSFPLFCMSTFLGGAYAAVVLSFRFAAADCVPADRRSRALSAVMAGGVLAGVVGPQLVISTMDLWRPYPFAATFLAQAGVALASAFILSGVRLPSAAAIEAAGGRPLGAVIRQRRFIAAVICGAISYSLMNFLMTAAPLAMQMCGLSQTSSDLGVQWHVIAMYSPGFFTGRLVARFGAPRVMGAGFGLIGAAAAAGLAGADVAHFWLALILLGVGWNFGFVGASSLVLECHLPSEKARVQPLYDFIVFGTMVVGSFLSGYLLTAYGWSMVVGLSLAPLAAASVALVVAGLSPRRHAISLDVRR